MLVSYNEGHIVRLFTLFISVHNQCYITAIYTSVIRTVFQNAVDNKSISLLICISELLGVIAHSIIESLLMWKGQPKYFSACKMYNFEYLSNTHTHLII